MSMRFEVRAAQHTQIEVVDHSDLDEDHPLTGDVDDHAVVLGDPYATALVVTGSVAELQAFARRILDVTQGQRLPDLVEHRVTFTGAAARAWLEAAAADGDERTNAESCGVFGPEDESVDGPFGWEHDRWFPIVEDLIGKASEAGLFGDGVDVSVILTADRQERCDGLRLAVHLTMPNGRDLDLVGSWSDGGATLNVGANDLVGIDAAVAVLEEAAVDARIIITNARRALTIEPAGGPADGPAAADRMSWGPGEIVVEPPAGS